MGMAFVSESLRKMRTKNRFNLGIQVSGLFSPPKYFRGRQRRHCRTEGGVGDRSGAVFSWPPFFHSLFFRLRFCREYQDIPIKILSRLLSLDWDGYRDWLIDWLIPEVAENVETILRKWNVKTEIGNKEFWNLRCGLRFASKYINSIQIPHTSVLRGR